MAKVGVEQIHPRFVAGLNQQSQASGSIEATRTLVVGRRVHHSQRRTGKAEVESILAAVIRKANGESNHQSVGQEQMIAGAGRELVAFHTDIGQAE